MPPEHRHRLQLIDAHYGGDVSRVVVGGIPRVPGDSVLAKRAWLQSDGDALRRLLLSAPYGEPAMCANVVVDPDLAAAEAGYVVMEAMGYPFFSGSNSICVVTALLEGGYLPMGAPGRQVVHVQVPAGLIRAEVEHDGRHVHSVTLTCDTAWVFDRGRTAMLPEFGEVTYDLVWSGCFYAVVDAEAHGFALSEPERPALADLGVSLCLVASPDLELTHPDHGDTGPLAFVNLSGPVTEADHGLEMRTATYVHPGVVCRCPTGTGTAARLALLADEGMLGVGDRVTSVSPTGSTMAGEIVERARLHGRDATTSTITGRAFTLGVTELVVNLDDDLTEAEGIWELLAGTAGS